MTLRSRVARWAFAATALVALYAACWRLAVWGTSTDFPILYRAGRLAMTPGFVSEQLYDPARLRSIPVPEPTTAGVDEHSRFVWPAIAARLLAGVAWLPYYPAKATMLALSILSYLWAIILFTSSLGAVRTALRWVLALAWMWPPFVETVLLAQINSFILLFVVLAVVAAKKGSPSLSGLSLAAASMAKLFPMGLAVFLGFKDWRVGLYALLFLGLALAGQPVAPWLNSMAQLGRWRSLPAMMLGGSNPLVVLLYSISILLAGAWVAQRRKQLGLEWLAVFGLVTVLLASPVYEYHHLTLLVIGYVYLLWPGRGNRIGRTCAVGSILSLSCASGLQGMPSAVMMWGGLAAIWLGLALGSTMAAAEPADGALSGPVSNGAFGL